MIVNLRVVVAFLPVYVIGMILLDIFFESSEFNTRNDLPLWLVIAFVASSVLTFGVLSWYFIQKGRGRISVKRERFYIGFLIALFISDSVDDVLRGLVSVAFNTASVWVMIPMYIFSYVIMWTVFVFVFTKVIKNPDAATPETAAGDR